jgi:predicted enzyme related to lactoylglutathione lyase
MSTRLAVYVDKTGKQPPAPAKLRLESVDAVKLAKFFASLGFTVEKQATPEGRQYVLAKATNVELSIFPSREPKTPDDWSMTLIVDDAAAAATRAESFGGTVASPLKDVPGGRKCVIASFEGHRVVVAQLGAATRPAAAPLPNATPSNGAPQPVVAETPIAAEKPVVVDKPTTVERPIATEKPAIAKPIVVARPIPVAKPLVAKPIEAEEPLVESEPDFLEEALAAEATATVDDDPLAVFDAPTSNGAGPSLAAPKLSLDKKEPPAEPARRKAPSGALVPAPDEYYEPAGGEALSIVSLQAQTLLRAVQKACGIAAAGILLPMFAGVVVYSTTGTTTQNLQLSYTIYGILAIVAAVAAIVAKVFCIGKRAEFADDGLVKSALILDVVALVISLSQNFIGPYSDFKIPLHIVYAVCTLIAPVLFVKYLGTIAAGMRERNLAASAKRSEISLIVAIAAILIAVAFGSILYLSGGKVPGKVGLVFLLVPLIIALVAFILYAALLAAFATSKTLKLVQGSAEIDPVARPAASSNSSAVGGGPLFAAADAGRSSDLSDPNVDAVNRLRATTGIMAGVWGLVIVVVIYAFATGSQVPFFNLFATALLTLAKLPCLNWSVDRLANKGLVTVAFVLDIVGLLGGIGLMVAAALKSLGGIMACQLLQGTCGLAATIVFISFLLQAADHLGMSNVMMFMKVARAFYYVFIGFVLFTIVVPLAVGVSAGGKAGAGLMLIGLIGIGLTGVIATLANMIGTVEMAINAKPPLRAKPVR